MIKEFMPTNAESALHMTAGIFEDQTAEEMRTKAKANRRHAMAAWRGSGERNGFGKPFDTAWRDKWTPEMATAEQAAFDFYDAMYWEAKTKKITKFAERVMAAHTAAAAKRAQVVAAAEGEATRVSARLKNLSESDAEHVAVIEAANTQVLDHASMMAEGQWRKDCEAGYEEALAEAVEANLAAANIKQPGLV